MSEADIHGKKENSIYFSATTMAKRNSLLKKLFT